MFKKYVILFLIIIYHLSGLAYAIDEKENLKDSMNRKLSSVKEYSSEKKSRNKNGYVMFSQLDQATGSLTALPVELNMQILTSLDISTLLSLKI